MKIGITERGDAGIDYTWLNKIEKRKVDGAILITKNITDEFIGKVIKLYPNFPQLIIHCTCTGWGSTKIEPNVPPYQKQLDQLCKLIQSGFPKEQCVLRVDPILPNNSGINRATKVLDMALEMGILPDMRIRISVLDEYRHVKKRFEESGLKPIYGDNFYASKYMMKTVETALSQYNLKFECCAEPYLNSDCFLHQGCISKRDIELMGLDISNITNSINPQNRNGCMCLSCKTELLSNRNRCPHKCIYCFWRD